MTGFDYRPNYLSKTEADRLLALLWRELDWRQYQIKLFGRRVMQPRLSAWSSDEGITYRYSGKTLVPADWHPELDRLRCRLKEECGCLFNSVLVNAYRDGQDAMGWHADDEPELGANPNIASISLGETRRFLVRPRSGGSSSGLDLEHGSLLLMSGRSQHETQHSIPRTRRQCKLRINLTFRRIRVDTDRARQR
jgi:alkylated DNA repair dioxygenase AlkB